MKEKEWKPAPGKSALIFESAAAQRDICKRAFAAARVPEMAALLAQGRLREAVADAWGSEAEGGGNRGFGAVLLEKRDGKKSKKKKKLYNI